MLARLHTFTLRSLYFCFSCNSPISIEALVFCDLVTSKDNYLWCPNNSFPNVWCASVTILAGKVLVEPFYSMEITRAMYVPLCPSACEACSRLFSRNCEVTGEHLTTAAALDLNSITSVTHCPDIYNRVCPCPQERANVHEFYII